jgi:hypothetical protein
LNKHLITAVGMALAIPAFPALATNGYFARGCGLKAKGMGGVATAPSSSARGFCERRGAAGHLKEMWLCHFR